LSTSPWLIPAAIFLFYPLTLHIPLPYSAFIFGLLQVDQLLTQRWLMGNLLSTRPHSDAGCQ